MSDGKTLGQIAKEAYGKEFRKSQSWEAAADAVIEECAKAIKARRWPMKPFPGDTAREQAAFALGLEEAMEVIRALKSSPTPQEGQ